MARGPVTFRQRDLVRALKGAKAAGLEIFKVEIDRDGKIVVIFGRSDAPHPDRQIVL
jgi:hypothetical protein